jgi:hypothetical protein
MTKILLTTVIKPFYIDSEDCTFQTQPELKDEVYYIFGKPTLKNKIMSGLAKIIAKNYNKKVENNKVNNQPKLQRIVYDEKSNKSLTNYYNQKLIQIKPIKN